MSLAFAQEPSGSGAAGAPPAGAAAAGVADLLLRGRLALRAMDCARCHGRDQAGWAAPSLLTAVREGSRQRFDTFVLDGDIARGMPGYREQPVVVDNLGAIYAYLRHLAGCEPQPLQVPCAGH